MTRFSFRRYTTRIAIARLVLCMSICFITGIQPTAASEPMEEFYQLGKQKYFDADFKTAIEILEKVVVSPDIRDTIRAEAYLYLGASYFGSGDTSLARQGFEGCIKNKPTFRITEKDFNPTIVRMFNDARDRLLCSVEIDSKPQRATVLIDGKSVGITPFRDDSFMPGKRSISLALEGYQQVNEEVEITKGVPNRIYYLLQTLMPTTLEITSDPSGADLYLDGVLVSTTPYSKADADTGVLFVKITASGYVPKEEYIHPEDGKANRFHFVLEKLVRRRVEAIERRDEIALSPSQGVRASDLRISFDYPIPYSSETFKDSWEGLLSVAFSYYHLIHNRLFLGSSFEYSLFQVKDEFISMKSHFLSPAISIGYVGRISDQTSIRPSFGFGYCWILHRVNRVKGLPGFDESGACIEPAIGFNFRSSRYVGVDLHSSYKVIFTRFQNYGKNDSTIRYIKFGIGLSLGI